MTALLAFADGAVAYTRAPRPFFKNRKFYVEEADALELTTDADEPVSILVYSEAINSCHLDPTQLSIGLRRLLSPTSTLWGVLNSLFENSRVALGRKQVEVAVDDFSTYAGDEPDFSGYMYKVKDKFIVGLDCSSGSVQNYWPSNLAHEFTHVLLDGTGAESWWEEALAQRMENSMGGMQPLMALGHLQTARQIPELMQVSRPLKSRENYAMAYLFARYVGSRFDGGTDVLKNMILPVAECEKSQLPYIARLACRAARFISSEKATGLYAPPLDFSKMTAHGLLRHFYVALTMNNAYEPKYAIPDWKGFDALPFEKTTRDLAYGQAMVSDAQTIAHQMAAKGYETYEILVGPSGLYDIHLLDDADSRSLSFSPNLKYYLMINLQSAGM